MSSESAGIQEQDHGVLYNLICLYSDVKLAEILVVMKYTLIRQSRLQSTKLFINTADLEGPKMTVRCMSEKLDRVKRADKKWTFKNIFKRLRATCFSPSRDLSPDFRQGAEKIAAHFQVTIIFCF